jgi:hypothetical protein
MFRRVFGGSSSGTPPSISVSFDPRPDNERFRLPYFFPGSEIYLNAQPIIGTLTIDAAAHTTVTHEGIQATLLGQIRVKTDGYLETFHSSKTRLSEPSHITGRTDIPFQIDGQLLPAASYYGSAHDIRWVVVFECLKSNLRKECPIYILFVDSLPEEGSPPRLVPWTIDDLLHCDICLDHSDLDVGACVVGTLFFDLVRVRICQIVFSVERIETFDNGILSSRLKAIVIEWELLDGEPFHGDKIPFRIFLPGIKLWPGPTKKLHLRVKYVVQFVAIGEDGQRFEVGIPCTLKRYVK